VACSSINHLNEMPTQRFIRSLLFDVSNAASSRLLVVSDVPIPRIAFIFYAFHLQEEAPALLSQQKTPKISQTFIVRTRQINPTQLGKNTLSQTSNSLALPNSLTFPYSPVLLSLTFLPSLEEPAALLPASA
jgi:hypothetical protein